MGLATLTLAPTPALTPGPNPGPNPSPNPAPDPNLTRWDSLPNAPWPPFRVYDLCTGAWLSFAYEDVVEVRLPAVGDQIA